MIYYVKVNSNNEVIASINEPTDGFKKAECTFDQRFPIDDNLYYKYSRGKVKVRDDGVEMKRLKEIRVDQVISEAIDKKERDQKTTIRTENKSKIDSIEACTTITELDALEWNG